MNILRFDPLQTTSTDANIIAQVDAFNFWFDVQLTIAVGTIVVFMAIQLANRA